MAKPDGGPAGCLAHGTCIALAGRGVLIRGRPGAGKSDLALRLIDASGCGIGAKELRARLIADDQVHLTRSGDRVVARSPGRLRDAIEIRGLGIVKVRSQAKARLDLVVELADRKSIERMPEAFLDTVLLGVRLPLLRLDASSPSAAARLRAGVLVLVDARQARSAKPARPARALSNWTSAP
jgi:serine kinase of HPr protein (carbohydrate metabolism regulator)